MHAFIDRSVVTLSALAAGKKKYFARSIDSPGYRELMETIEMKVPEIGGEGRYNAHALWQGVDLAPAFLVRKWAGRDCPTIIYHHGSGERPFQFGPLAKNTQARILPKSKIRRDINLISVRAPFHDATIAHYLKMMADLRNWMAMLVTSTMLIERIVRSQRTPDGPVTITGISLGGLVTNLHRAFYNTGDAYVPLLAGAAMGDLFTNSIYRKLTGRLARENPDKVAAALDFEAEFKKIKDYNVFPLLGRFDQVITCERQKSSYGDCPVYVVNGGHATVGLRYSLLRRHILAHVPQRSTR